MPFLKRRKLSKRKFFEKSQPKTGRPNEKWLQSHFFEWILYKKQSQKTYLKKVENLALS